MQSRMDYMKASPDGYKAMSALQHYVRQSGLESSLLELIARFPNQRLCVLPRHAHQRRSGPRRN
jgi:hypothetical protein